MAKIDVKTETDSPRGWTFAVVVHADGRALHEYQVTLSWADYDHWSHGRIAPERVVAAAVRFILDQGGSDNVGDHFDCARLRRLWPQIDRVIPTLF